MRYLFVLLYAFVFHSVYAQSNRFVRVSQAQFIDSASQPVYLNGVCLGNWLLWEGWMMGGGFIQETIIKERLKELLGTEDYTHFLTTYYNTFITEKDIAQIKQQGFNSIRLPFNYRLFTDTDNDGIDGFRILDNLVSWCKKYKVYLILDMHAAPGGQSPWFIADPSKDKLWESDKCKQQTLQIWTKIAGRYRNESIIAGYDLLNEPYVSNPSTLVSFYTDIIRAIRAVDANHLLIAEGNKLAKEFNSFPDHLDDNQIYSYHYYAWFAENKKENSLQSITKSVNSKLPLWCGEWGEDKVNNLEEIRSLLNKQTNLCGTAFWTWKRVYKNNGRQPLCTIHSTPDWDRIISWVTWHIAKPKPEQVQKAIAGFLEAIQLDHCTVNEPVINAIRR